MDKADAMYGVSMDASGVSHVFSVRPGAVAEAAQDGPRRGSSVTPDEPDLVQSVP
jgi:hypothetical protein